MSSAEVPAQACALVDFIAQTIQALHSNRHLDPERPLLRIDNLAEAAQAPYQFDAAGSRLHRRGCRSIPARSRLALYGVWQMGAEDRTLACPRCKPVPMKDEPDNRSDAADMLLGLVSLIDQFGSVLRERGQEFRKSTDGRQFSSRFEGLFQGLDRREQDFLTSLMSSMDGLIKTVRDLDDRLNQDKDDAHGHEADQADNRDPADQT